MLLHIIDQHAFHCLNEIFRICLQFRFMITCILCLFVATMFQTTWKVLSFHWNKMNLIEEKQQLLLLNLNLKICKFNSLSKSFFSMLFALTALFICLKTLSCCLGHMKIFIGFLAILVFVKKQAFEIQDFVRIPIGLSYMSFTFPSQLYSPLIIKLLPLLFIIRGNILKNVVPLRTLFIQSVTGLSP